MKLAVFHNLPFGGADRTLYEQLKYLSDNHVIHLYLLSFKSKENKLTKFADKVYVYNFEVNSLLPSFLNRLEKDVDNFINLKFVQKKIADDINRRYYDAVLVHSDMYTEAPFLLRYLKIPNVYHCHELLRIAYERVLKFNDNTSFYKRIYESLTRKIRKDIDKRNAQASDYILTSSYYIADKVRSTYEKEPFTCHLGVDSNVFRKKNSKKIPQILFIGGRNKLKGYYLARKAFDIVEQKHKANLKVLGYGKGDFTISDDNELAEEYSRSVATLCSAYSEPFGLVALESMSCETPVLAVNEGGYKESVIDGKTGFLLKRNAKEFANKIIYLIEHPKIVKSMGKAGRKHVINNFSWEKHGACVEKHLLKIAGKEK